MKIFVILLSCLSSFASIVGQNTEIETKSVTINNFLSYVVEHAAMPVDSLPSQNLTLLIETYDKNFTVEDKTVLKHGLKLLSERLREQDRVNLVAYSKFNGIIQKAVKGSNAKLLLHSIEQPTVQQIEGYHDGIDLAYNLARDTYFQNGINRVVMIRNPFAKKQVKQSTSQESNVTVQKKPKAAGNAVVITAITLLPEIIRVIKN